MANENDRLDKLKERLSNPYRLVVMNDDTFEEIGSYRLTRLNLYILLSSTLVIVVLLVTFLIILTPIKEYIPGYGDVNVREKINKVNRQLGELEEEIEAREVYIESMQKMLVGDYEQLPEESLIKEAQAADTLTVEIKEPSKAEYEIRREVEQEQLIDFSSSPSNVKVINQENTLDASYFVSPIKGGDISDDYQPEKSHYGIDLVAPTNTPILSALDGIVIMADWTYENGYVIGVQHSNNVVTFYKHNAKLFKKVGDKVNAGDAIAIIGNTGALSFGAHLHFELWYNGKPVDPSMYISF